MREGFLGIAQQRGRALLPRCCFPRGRRWSSERVLQKACWGFGCCGDDGGGFGAPLSGGHFGKVLLFAGVAGAGGVGAITILRKSIEALEIQASMRLVSRKAASSGSLG